MTGESSLNGKTSLFHNEEGGSIPTLSHLKVYECKFKEIRHIFEQFHYKGGHMGGGISWCLALVNNLEIVGGVVIGKPRHEQKYSDNGKVKVVELRRMACLEHCPKNTESYFLGKVKWWLKKNTDIEKIISYSDLSVGHIGTIYKASGYKLIGETAPSKHIFWEGKRYHPRSLTIDRPYSYKLREAVKSGEAVVETGKAKLIFENIIFK
jgi:hypothetical protein